MLSGGGGGSWALDEEGGIIKALEHENSEKEEGSWLEGGRKKDFFSWNIRAEETWPDRRRPI